ncbi:HisA/HisF-related TIM barrel protein [Streptomyces microflavus]|uniref:HisA/HisF-related TIM barrel protein n=1 Tax=Streptomyces microflavus TaxID=1919 RepID=UPI002E10DB5F|nr:HisA/HisF-related TIM barrel protein [Streptomyces microflavus]WSR95784.1 HisA/HisF-related TIM barrel protein [Streptomyces microflavus]
MNSYAESPVVPVIDVSKGLSVTPAAIGHLVDPQDPVALVEHYRDSGAKRIFVDILDSWQDTPAVLDLVARLARVSTGLWVSVENGSLPSLREADLLLGAGADAVSVSTSAFDRPSLIKSLADRHGPERVVGVLNVRRSGPETWLVCVDGGSRRTPLDAVVWARMLADLGAGYILPNSLDGEGGGTGYDMDLIRAMSCAVDVPVVASGGCGSAEHIHDALSLAGAKYAIVNKVVHSGRLSLSDALGHLRERGIVWEADAAASSPQSSDVAGP